MDDWVSIQVDGRPLQCRRGRPLLNELLINGLVVATACGGQGSCHLCRVTVVERGALPEANALEVRALGNVLIAGGMRLSCQLRCDGPFSVSLPVVETAEQRRARIRAARERKKP